MFLQTIPYYVTFIVAHDCQLFTDSTASESETPTREGRGCISAGPEEGHRKDQNSLPVPKGAYRKEGDQLFIRECGDSTSGGVFKLKEGRFRLDIRKKFFVRVERPWNLLPKESVNILGCFKARLGEVWGCPAWWEVKKLL